MSYSIDLREHVIKFTEEGGSKTEAARIFGVSRFMVHYWLKKKTKTGVVKDAAPKKKGWKKNLNNYTVLDYIIMIN